ncbi:WapI family immunity protein [Ensifer adhaerens]|uniref:WapI family immunity protein n=1 Tax=Ensifer adhaerens TaxID=106592 RepID=UPI000CF0EA5D|nr:hypothetical protein [Ensifer adhaerens]
MREPDEPSGLQLVAFQGRHSSLRMAIRQYQFPDVMDDAWDSNWLIVEGHVDIKGRKWTFRDPCLTTFEAEHLADWLEEVSNAEPSKVDCRFTEPNLEFRYQKNRQLRISFALESGPPGFGTPSSWDERSFLVPVSSALATAATQLRQQLVRFPRRGPHPTRLR